MSVALRHQPEVTGFFRESERVDLGAPRRILLTEHGAGKSHEFVVIRCLARNAAAHFSRPYSRVFQEPSARFYGCYAEWKAGTRYLSDTNAICTHFAYQKIVGMGVEALPFIFRELRVRPDHWFWALKAITNQDPVPEEHLGRMKLMAQDWLAWAKRNGIA
jgi:hypothetical protein